MFSTRMAVFTTYSRSRIMFYVLSTMNQLPSDIRNMQSLGSFKHRLKTHLFNCDWQLTCQSNTVFRGTLTIRALVMGDGVPCYGALEIVGLLLLLLTALLGCVCLSVTCLDLTRERKPTNGRMEAYNTDNPWTYFEVKRSMPTGQLMLSQTMHHTQVRGITMFLN